MSFLPGGIGGGMTKKTIDRAASVVAGNDPARWVDEHGDVLYRYALTRVRKPDVAQDLVQETFLAAVRGHEKFAGQSSVRSWLCGILKHKLCDYYRKLGRETSFTDLESRRRMRRKICAGRLLASHERPKRMDTGGR